MALIHIKKRAKKKLPPIECHPPIKLKTIYEATKGSSKYVLVCNKVIDDYDSLVAGGSERVLILCDRNHRIRDLLKKNSKFVSPSADVKKTNTLTHITHPKVISTPQALLSYKGVSLLDKICFCRYDIIIIDCGFHRLYYSLTDTFTKVFELIRCLLTLTDKVIITNNIGGVVRWHIDFYKVYITRQPMNPLYIIDNEQMATNDVIAPIKLHTNNVVIICKTNLLDPNDAYVKSLTASAIGRDLCSDKSDKKTLNDWFKTKKLHSQILSMLYRKKMQSNQTDIGFRLYDTVVTRKEPASVICSTPAQANFIYEMFTDIFNGITLIPSVVGKKKTKRVVLLTSSAAAAEEEEEIDYEGVRLYVCTNYVSKIPPANRIFVLVSDVHLSVSSLVQNLYIMRECHTAKVFIHVKYGKQTDSSKWLVENKGFTTTVNDGKSVVLELDEHQIFLKKKHLVEKRLFNCDQMYEMLFATALAKPPSIAKLVTQTPILTESDIKRALLEASISDDLEDITLDSNFDVLVKKLIVTKYGITADKYNIIKYMKISPQFPNLLEAIKYCTYRLSFVGVHLVNFVNSLDVSVVMNAKKMYNNYFASVLANKNEEEEEEEERCQNPFTPTQESNMRIELLSVVNTKTLKRCIYNYLVGTFSTKWGKYDSFKEFTKLFSIVKTINASGKTPEKLLETSNEQIEWLIGKLPNTLDIRCKNKLELLYDYYINRPTKIVDTSISMPSVNFAMGVLLS